MVDTGVDRRPEWYSPLDTPRYTLQTPTVPGISAFTLVTVTHLITWYTNAIVEGVFGQMSFLASLILITLKFTKSWHITMLQPITVHDTEVREFYWIEHCNRL